MVAMATMLPWQQDLWLIPIVLRNLQMYYKLNCAKDKGAADISMWLPWQPFHLGSLGFDNFELSLGTYVPNIFFIGFQAKEF